MLLLVNTGWLSPELSMQYIRTSMTRAVDNWIGSSLSEIEKYLAVLNKEWLVHKISLIKPLQTVLKIENSRSHVRKPELTKGKGIKNIGLDNGS